VSRKDTDVHQAHCCRCWSCAHHNAHSVRQHRIPLLDGSRCICRICRICRIQWLEAGDDGDEEADEEADARQRRLLIQWRVVTLS
jgi:hypothetical protein